MGFVPLGVVLNSQLNLLASHSVVKASSDTPSLLFRGHVGLVDQSV
jgi:hypothetical protein